MRRAMITAVLSLPFALLTSCAEGGGGVSTISEPATATEAPQRGSDFAAVAAWVDAADPADPNDFGVVTSNGTSSEIDGVVFVAEGTGIECAITATLVAERTACRVDFADPLPEPPGREGNWLPDWVDFAGTHVDVGSFRGDAGPFANGSGHELAVGRSLESGEYRCRVDDDAVFCLSDADQSAVRLAASGVDVFGCLRESAPPRPRHGRTVHLLSQAAGRTRSRTRAG